jgi:group II intron reverse transcriptase/maturase
MNVTDEGAKRSKPYQSVGVSPQKDSAEHESYAGGCSPSRITENNPGSSPGQAITDGNGTEARLLERILERNNMNLAYKRVKANKGAGGVDGMQVKDLLAYLTENGEAIKQAIMEGKYKPNPVRRVEIPKDDGKKRPLGIPTVVDRVIQQAIAQVLSPIFERQFSNNSFGFRPNRSAHGAIKRSQEYIDDGYKYVVDMDLEKFFDTVNQSKLVEVLGRTIKDGRVISLIHKYLNAGVVVKHSFKETTEGVPQGGPLSPLLSNIMRNYNARVQIFVDERYYTPVFDSASQHFH